MTDRKFLQETNFDDDIDFDSESEDRQNEMWRRRLRQLERQKDSVRDNWSNSINPE